MHKEHPYYLLASTPVTRTHTAESPVFANHGSLPGRQQKGSSRPPHRQPHSPRSNPCSSRTATASQPYPAARRGAAKLNFHSPKAQESRPARLPGRCPSCRGTEVAGGEARSRLKDGHRGSPCAGISLTRRASLGLCSRTPSYSAQQALPRPTALF